MSMVSLPCVFEQANDRFPAGFSAKLVIFVQKLA